MNDFDFLIFCQQLQHNEAISVRDKQAINASLSRMEPEALVRWVFIYASLDPDLYAVAERDHTPQEQWDDLSLLMFPSHPWTRGHLARKQHVHELITVVDDMAVVSGMIRLTLRGPKFTTPPEYLCAQINANMWQVMIPKHRFTAFCLEYLSPTHTEASVLIPHFDATLAYTRKIENTIETKLNLYDHQKKGVQFILDLCAESSNTGVRGGILGDEMGLGKTAQMIVAADNLARQFVGAKIVIVCPVSIKRVWADEIQKFLTTEESVQIISTASDTIDATAKWLIINYDIVHHYERSLREQIAPLMLILDEAHYLKNPDSERTCAIVGGTYNGVSYEGICKASAFVWAVSGTPTEGRNRDLYPLLAAINHPLARNGFLAFADRYCGLKRVSGRTVTSASTNTGELAQKIAGIYLRRTKSQCLDLPEKNYQIINVDLGSAAHADYEDNLSRISTANPLVRRGYMETCRKTVSLAKVPHTLALIDEALDEGQRPVVFVWFTQVVEALEAHCKKNGIKYVKITGDTSPAQRENAYKTFQSDPSVKVFIGNIMAAGVGITLTSSQLSLFHDYPWLPTQLRQCIDRLHRIGQTGVVDVKFITGTDTFDQFVVDSLLRRMAVVDQINAGASETSIEDDCLASILSKKTVKRVIRKNS